MEKKQQFLPAFVILMLTVTACLGFASANPVADEYGIDTERGELTSNEYMTAIEFLKSKENVIDKRGYLPEFKDAQHRRAWYNVLDNLTSDMFDSVKPYLYPDGPIIGFGYDIEGYVGIGVVEGYSQDKADIAVNEICTMLNEEASKSGIEDVPVKVRSVDPDSLVLHSASDRFRPVIGGVQMQAILGSSTGTGTIGWAAQNTAGTLGYVIAGHCSDGVGETIYQPSVSASNTVGTVAADTQWPSQSSYADAAWVPYSNVAAKIYGSGGVQETVKGYYADCGVGLSVYKSGAVTGTTSGVTIRKDIVFDGGTKKYLYNQHFASFSATNGDSGAPVYHVEPDHDRIVVGLYSGSFNGENYFSPVSGVQSELGVLPITG
ncbi:hypothetical protein F8E02_03040 [Methanoculleus sp. Wushi-C6]|uniref:Uncharacterized protein n=1 Tax=Methanoculleus caldifontis TaxID=2651577 RepID=A0ABU3WYX9_9EURY|nr:hypothetical protein [Methanoculleus sp. Wushi-C6]MDV2480999.1 hypothetical protein [Methanoculleus sp. Wushi-C6]